MDICTQKYKIVIPANICRVLCPWSECMTITKNATIKTINQINDNKDLNAQILFLVLVNSSSDFVK